MTRTETFDEARIRLLVPAAENQDQKVARHVAGLLAELRIEAEVEAVVGRDADAIVARSADACVVFLPLRLAGLRPVDPFGGDCAALIERLPLVALVGAAQAVELGEEPPASTG